MKSPPKGNARDMRVFHVHSTPCFMYMKHPAISHIATCDMYISQQQMRQTVIQDARLSC